MQMLHVCALSYVLRSMRVVFVCSLCGPTHTHTHTRFVNAEECWVTCKVTSRSPGDWNSAVFGRCRTMINRTGSAWGNRRANGPLYVGEALMAGILLHPSLSSRQRFSRWKKTWALFRHVKAGFNGKTGSIRRQTLSRVYGERGHAREEWHRRERERFTF